MPSEAIKGYIAKVNADPSSHPGNNASHTDIVNHAKGLGFSFSEQEIKDHLDSDGVNNAGGGGCNFNDVIF
jgi:predicted ribosomally synthesized peptide with nif11-like leader